MTKKKKALLEEELEPKKKTGGEVKKTKKPKVKKGLGKLRKKLEKIKPKVKDKKREKQIEEIKDEIEEKVLAEVEEKLRALDEDETLVEKEPEEEGESEDEEELEDEEPEEPEEPEDEELEDEEEIEEDEEEEGGEDEDLETEEDDDFEIAGGPLEDEDEEKGDEVEDEEPEDEEEDSVEFADDGEEDETEEDEKNLDIGKRLEEIYEDSDGKIPDMKTFKRKKKSKFMRAFLVLVISCIFLGVVAWVGFFILQPRSGFSEEDVTVTISGNEEVGAGEEVTYRVRYRNAQNTALEQVVLQVRYPEGFVFESASEDPTNEDQDEWSLGNIEAQGSGYIDIKGKMYGDLDEKQSFRIFLNYKPTNFSSDFQKVTNLTVTIGESLVGLEVDLDKTLLQGAETEITLTIKPGEDPVENVTIVVEPGDVFSKKSSDPDSDEGKELEWSFDKLEEETTINLVGSFSPGEDQEKETFVVKILGWDSADRKGDSFVLSSSDNEVEFIKNDVAAQLVINGGVGEFTITPGEVLSSSITIKNSSEGSIENAVVNLIFDAPSYDRKSLLHWANLEVEGDADIYGEQLEDTVRRGIITWKEEYIPALGTLSPGDRITLDAHMPIKTTDVMDLSNFSTYEVSARVEIEYKTEGLTETITSNEIKMIVNSDLDLEVQDEIEAVANGEEHAVTWLLTNSLHELKDIRLEADFYGDTEWDAGSLVVPTGEAEFDPTAKKLVWIIDTMPQSVDVLALQFAVTLKDKNPSQSNLTSKVKIVATDTVTGKEMILMGEEILLDHE